MGFKFISLLRFKVFRKSKKISFENSSFNLSIFTSFKKFFQVFSFVLHFQNLCFLTSLSYSLQNLSFGILYCEKCCLWSLWSPSVVITLLLCALVLCLPSCILVIALCISFVPWLCIHLLCRGCILCGVLSEVKIVKIFHAVKTEMQSKWLEP